VVLQHGGWAGVVKHLSCYETLHKASDKNKSFIQELRRVFFVQVETQLSYNVFIIILKCFGLDNGPSSGHKTYISG